MMGISAQGSPSGWGRCASREIIIPYFPCVLPLSSSGSGTLRAGTRLFGQRPKFSLFPPLPPPPEALWVLRRCHNAGGMSPKIHYWPVLPKEREAGTQRTDLQEQIFPHEEPQPNGGALNVASPGVLTPCSPSGARRRGSSLAPTPPVTAHGQILPSGSAFAAALFDPGVPGVSLATTPDGAPRVSKPCQRGWDAGILPVVPSFILHGQLSASQKQSPSCQGRAVIPLFKHEQSQSCQ